MKTKNLIGLDSENAQQVVNLLNELLANYQIYYQNLRGFHWNVRGNRFFVLHAKFEELYNDAIEKVDEITLPNTDIQRKIVVIKKIKSTPNKYPRKAGMPLKEPIL